MKFEDIKEGMCLRNMVSGESCEVTYCGPYDWSVIYDGLDEPRRFSYKPYQARSFEADATGTLYRHPAVAAYRNGVSSDDLASFTSQLGRFAAERVRTVGHRDYGQGERQRFEGLSPADLAREMLEEAADAINYLAMASVRMLAICRAAKEAE